ncbi:MAG: PDZ domain-containing protein, partial [Actinomycetia bacterium]|nr:PDZ domain-containing protein [Actinomycetes bacterium]
MSDAYLRYPDVHGDEIVFTADDDVWLSDLSGGRAQRLTRDHVRVAYPRFSGDGTRIAWTSWRTGAPDAYVLDRASGAITRLTWWGRNTRTVGWHAGRVLVSSGHEEVTPAVTRLYEVGLDGEVDRSLRSLGLVGAADWDDDGRVVLETATFSHGVFWKRYRGGTAAKLWVGTPAGGFTRLLGDEPAPCEGPVWHRGRILFTSDLSAGRAHITDPTAQAQLFSIDPRGTDLRCHTAHTSAQGYVRDPRSDGRTIVFNARGRLFALDGLEPDAVPREIVPDLGVGAPASVALDVTDNLDDVLPDHKGTGSLVGWRGGVYYLTHRDGPARALGVTDGVRRREPVVLGTTGSWVCVTDADGADALEVAPLDGLGERRLLAGGELGYVLHLAASPDGAQLAVSSHDGTLRLVTLADGTVRSLDRSGAGEIADLAWSPDSRFLVWSAPVGSEAEPRAQLRCADVTAGDPAWQVLTSGAYDDAEPTFTRDGKHLAWIARRTFDPRYAGHGFSLASVNAARPWLSPLAADTLLPFGVSADGWPLAKPEEPDAGKAEAKGGHDDEKADEAPTPVRLDLDGFEARAVALPVPSGEYGNLRSVKDGLAWLREPGLGGVLGATWAGAPGDGPVDVLERFSFETRKTETLVDKADSFEVSGDGEILVVRHRDDVTAQPARRVEADDDESLVRVDLGRLRRRLDARAEWRQMFDENGRLMALHYWREDMNGVDWPGVLARYRELIGRCLSADDVRDVLAECVGELNTSHAYVSPPVGDPSREATGYLGVDVTRTPEGFRIERVLPGLPSDPSAWQPLRRAGVDAREGDIIVAVDGRPAAGEPALGALLEGAAGKPVEVVLRRAGAGDRRVGVVPLPREDGLRYQAWVAGRRTRVEERAGGRLGYVHVPDMVARGWAQLERMVDEASAHDGVIADLRYNGGGHTSQLVLERLFRRVLGWDAARYFEVPQTYPAQAMRGPVVVLTNEVAASDGDVGTAVARLHGFTVVGTRTWGGVIGIDGRFALVDGTEVTQPRYAGWFERFGWDIENRGVDPDIEVVVP